MSQPATDSPQRPSDHAAGVDPLASIQRQLRWLTVAVFLVALALFFNMATVFGYIVDFHSGESILVGGASAGGIVVGFLFGWLARCAAGPHI